MKRQRWQVNSEGHPENTGVLNKSADFLGSESGSPESGGESFVDSGRTPKRFYPDYLLEILFFAFIIIELNVVLALLFPPSIGRGINFISPYQPRPEWYYLWLFGLLRYFYGGLAVVGGVIIPFLAIVSLFLIPWIDKRLGRVSATIIIVILLLFFIGSVFLV